MAAQTSARHRIRASNPSSFSSARLLPRPHPHRTLFLLPVAHCLFPVRHSYSAASTKTAPSTARPLLAHRPRRSVPRLRPPRELVQVLLVQLLPTHRRGIPAYAVRLPLDHRPMESLDPQRLRLLNICCRISNAGPIHAKTKSAPRICSDCNRSIHSATRRGSSRCTSPQSPMGASSERGRQRRCTLVASAADSRARILVAISVAIGQEPVIVHPPRIMPESNASQPSVVLCAKTTEPTPSSRSTRRPSAKAFAIVSSNHARSFGRP